MPRLAFVEADHNRPFPNNSGGIQFLDLTTCSVSSLQAYCREFGLKKLERRGLAYLDALREFSGDPSKWIQRTLERTQVPTKQPSLKTKKKPIRSIKQNMEERKIEAGAWLTGVNLLVDDTYNVLPSMASSSAILNPKKHAPQGYISSETTKLFVSLASLEQLSVFYEKFHVTLSRGRHITFSMKDIGEYPSISMPKHSSQQYLQKLLAVWDDDLPTWDPQNICPTIGGEKLAVKHWKMVFSKAGHWRVSRIRTQWHGWKALMSELKSYGHSVEHLLQAHWDMSREQGSGIKVISKHLREQKRKF